MTYTKQAWETGEVITADKLNHIEDGIENNNPGYEIVKSEQLILDETVTVTIPQGAPFDAAQFEYNELINYPTITVDFNGDIYECELIDKNAPNPTYYYGGIGSSGPVFTEYPFAIISVEQQSGQYINVLYVENSGDYSVKIYAKESTINTTEDFEKSVAKIISENVSSIKNLKDDPSNSGGTIEGMIVGATATHESTGQSFIIDDETSNKATGAFAHAEGGLLSFFSEAEPPYQLHFTTASGDGSHAEGGKTTASGECSHAEGYFTTANGNYSHAEGLYTTASGGVSHAEGSSTTASEYGSHAEGSGTTASGYGSHAEGNGTTASGNYSHAEGITTTASGYGSHAEGNGTKASSGYQHVQGKYNIEDSNDTYAFIIGNGTGSNALSNAFAMKWDGTFVFANGTEITPAQFTSLLALLN